MKKNSIGALPAPQPSASNRIFGNLSRLFSSLKKRASSLAYMCQIRTKSDRYYALSVLFMVVTLFIPVVVFVSAFYLYRAKKAEKNEMNKKS